MGSYELSEVQEDAVWIESDGIVMRKTRRQVPPKINTAHGVGQHCIEHSTDHCRKTTIEPLERWQRSTNQVGTQRFWIDKPLLYLLRV